MQYANLSNRQYDRLSPPSRGAPPQSLRVALALRRGRVLKEEK
jgi:hypothetical protein